MAKKAKECPCVQQERPLAIWPPFWTFSSGPSSKNCAEMSTKLNEDEEEGDQSWGGRRAWLLATWAILSYYYLMPLMKKLPRLGTTLSEGHWCSILHSVRKLLKKSYFTTWRATLWSIHNLWFIFFVNFTLILMHFKSHFYPFYPHFYPFYSHFTHFTLSFTHFTLIFPNFTLIFIQFNLIFTLILFHYTLILVDSNSWKVLRKMSHFWWFSLHCETVLDLLELRSVPSSQHVMNV